MARSAAKPLEREEISIVWREWAAPAFTTAQQTKRPVFLYLTIPYSHQVHLFERHALADPEVVNRLNREYVPIRVLASKRPDISERYNQGSWPSVCILSPDGGLLLGRTGLTTPELKTLLKETSRYYAANREAIEIAISEQGETVLPRLRATVLDAGRPTALDSIRQDALAWHDSRFEGFGRAPKLPMPDLLMFLLEDPSEELRRLAFSALDTMRVSALHDHLNGGFFRACADEAWRLPAFEKLLTDNLKLCEAYLEAHRQSGEDRFLDTARRTVSFIEEALGDASGLLYSALDSDSQPGERSSYYGWSEAEIRSAVEDPSTAQLLITHFGVGPETSIPDGSGRSTFEQRVAEYQLGIRFGMQTEEVVSLLQAGTTILRGLQSQRLRPGVDDSFFWGEQAMAMGLLAQASILLNRPRLLQRAFEIADLLWLHGKQEEGGIQREYGTSDTTLYLVDQIETVLGYMELYRIAGRANDLIRAEKLAGETWDLLGDREGCGCLDHTPRAEDVAATAVPYTPFESNSRLLLAATLLSAYTQDSSWHQRALELAQGLEAMRPSQRMRDASYGRALRRLVTAPPLVDLITGEGSGEMRVRLLREAPCGTLIRAFDPEQRTPWTSLERYPSNGSRARAVVYTHERQFEATHDVDVALMHLNELV